MVPPSSDQVSRVWPYSGYCAAAPVFAYVSLTLSGWLSHTIRLTVAVLKAVRTPGVFLPQVWPLPRSLATTYGISVDVSSSPYLDVSVQAVPLIQCMVPEYCSGGFPHSEICGSKIICISPQLIAAYHVFHRLPVPRHSPCALSSLTVPYRLSTISAFQILHLPTRFNQNCSFNCFSFRSFLLFSFQGASVTLRSHLPSTSSKCIPPKPGRCTRVTKGRLLILRFRFV